MKYRFPYPIALLFVFLATSSVVAQALFPVAIEINESGEPPLWSIDITARSSTLLNIVAPDGSMLLPERTGKLFHEKTFDTLESALSTLNGEWSVTDFTGVRQFSVHPINSEELNRSVPIVTSPDPGFAARNGEAFLLAWEYEPFTVGDEAPNRSAILLQRTVPETSRYSRSILSTPSQGSDISGAGSSGDFTTRLTSEPEADTNRWLLTLSSDQELPQTFDIQIGSYVSMDDFLDTPLLDPTRPSRGPLATLAFSRSATDTISVTLVPEPDGGAAFAVAGLLVSLLRRFKTR